MPCSCADHGCKDRFLGLGVSEIFENEGRNMARSIFIVSKERKAQ